MVAELLILSQAIINLAQNATQWTTDNDSVLSGSEIAKSKVSFLVQEKGEGITPANSNKFLRDLLAL
jgi:K+-sensing histidine kinase KdpD